MKVLQIITTLNIGGAEKLIADSIPIYQMNGLEMDVLVLKDGSTDFRTYLDKNSTSKVIGLTKGSVYNPFIIFKLIKYLKKYDLAHVHLFPTLYFVVLAKLISFSKIKVIYTEHSTNNKRRKIRIFKALDKFIYSRLDFIGCISEATKSNLQKHLNYKKDNISVILNGINLENFNINEKKFSFFSSDSFVLIQVSSFREQKDQLTLIKSLTSLPFIVKLLLVGEGYLKKNNELFVEQLGLQNRVLFLGARNDVADLMNYADVCVLSSHYEGFGLAVLEGMASGKPSVTCDIEGVREIVDGYGLLFTQGNAEELANHILSLYTDKKYYGEIAKKCYERAKDFDINEMVQKYIKIYKKVLSI